jgi:hypothetical protein
MALKIYEFDTVKEMEFFLRGGITGGKVAHKNGRIHGLHGRTLVLTAPAATVTFADPTGAGLTLAEVATQIHAVAAAVSVNWLSGALGLVMTTPTAAVVLSASGTANTIFGFSNSTSNTGRYFNGPAGTTPRLVETNNKSRLDGYYAVVEV